MRYIINRIHKPPQNLKFACPFCGNADTTEYFGGTRRFFRCGDESATDIEYSTKTFVIRTKCNEDSMHGCGGVFVDPEYFLTPHEQGMRYTLHQNILEPLDVGGGYRNFLTKFADTAFLYLHNLGETSSVRTIFDYGSGPQPALVQLLNEYKDRGQLAKTTEIRGWDPFFAPDTLFFENGADIVFCLEVAEHFENPLKGFEGLARASGIGGIVVLQTMLVPHSYDEFKKWWYKDDTTHVSFYSYKALALCAKRAHLDIEAHIGSVFFFRHNMS